LICAQICIILNFITMKIISKLSGKYDLAAIIALTLLLIPLAIYTGGAVRIILGLPFVLFFPGYTLIAALFPKKDSIGDIERVALSFGLSIAVVPLIGLILNYVWEISLYPILISTTVFIVVMCIVTYFRRRQLAPEQRFEPKINLHAPQWKGQGRFDRALSVILAISIIAAIGTLIYVVATPKTGERFTEFYILGADGTASDYPKVLTVGENAEVIVGITNHEGENTSYQVRININGTQVKEIGPMTLSNEQKWEGNVSFAPAKAGDNQKVEFLLYNSSVAPEPYLETHIWVNVSSP
jgi:uncharacterized membrane protein